MRIILLSILLLLICFPGLSFALTGKVISVADGDTITVLDSRNKKHKIRLYGIDCPEKGQAYGKKAKQAIVKILKGREVKVKVSDYKIT